MGRRNSSFPLFFLPFVFFLSLFFVACGEETAILPEAGPPPPPPVVTADSATLHKLGTVIEQWLMTGDSVSLASVTDLRTFMERVFYPDSLSAEEKERLESMLNDPDEYRRRGAEIWESGVREKGMKWKFLGVHREEGGASLIFRGMWPQGTIDYMEVLLSQDQQGNPMVCDLQGFAEGEYGTRFAHRVITADQRSEIEKLFDFNNQGAEVMAQVHEAEVLAEEGNNQEALELLQNIPAPYQQTRIVQVHTLMVKREVYTEKIYLRSLNNFVKKFGNEPRSGLLLFELYHTVDDYGKALQAINALDSVVHDPFLNTLRGTVHLSSGNVEMADSCLHISLAEDSSSVLTNRVLFFTSILRKDYGEATQSLNRLNTSGTPWPELEETLNDPGFNEFKAAPEYNRIKPIIEGLSKPHPSGS